MNQLLDALVEKNNLVSFTLQREEISENATEKLIEFLYENKRIQCFEMSFCKIALVSFNQVVE